MRAPSLIRARTPARGAAALLLLASCIGCGENSSPSGSTGNGDGSSTAASTAVGTTYATPDACMSSEDCETSGHCIAPYDPGPTEDPSGRGPAACVDACIEEDDLQRWCVDDDACCGDLRCNEVDGFCESLPSPGESSSSGSGSSGSGSSGSVGSGTGGGSSSESGSGSGSGSGSSSSG